MKKWAIIIASLLGVLISADSASAQELEPGIYAPAPVGTTIVLAGVDGSKGRHPPGPVFGRGERGGRPHDCHGRRGYTFGLAGRQARVLAVFPIASGDIRGDVHTLAERQPLDGLADPRTRLSVGLRGAPARTAADLATVTQEPVIGAAVMVMPPLGGMLSRSN